ncbi:MAG: ParB/RepB/Spo0J family partition protein [Tissierellia bacterium]|nr:ParB/RepB/Spo0J family partition protein [Tissierellia bacterium]
MARKGGLGKGLGALIPEMPTDPADNIKYVEMGKINPREDQPRQHFERGALEDLAASIRIHGILQPLILRRTGDSYEIIAGERRYRAAKLADLDEVPAVIKDVDDGSVKEISIIENIQREDLNPMEEASAYKELMEEYKLTQEQLAAKVGKSRSYVANALRLLKLDPETMSYLVKGDLTISQGRTLLSIADPKQRQSTLEKLLSKDTNIREIERISKGTRRLKQDIYLKEIEEEIGELLAAKVRLLPKKKGGRIEIEYYDESDLERIYELFKGGVQ